MARTATTQLSAKHWKALELIEEGTLSIKEIALSVGWSAKNIYDLMSGNTARTGSIGELFYSELKKQHARNTSKVKHLFKENQRLALIKVNERLRDLQSQKPTDAITKEICKLMNSLGKAGPSVEISNTSYSVTHGMTPEELVHEFKRLGTLARSTLEGGGVSCPTTGGAGTLPSPTGGGSKISQES